MFSVVFFILFISSIGQLQVNSAEYCSSFRWVAHVVGALPERGPACSLGPVAAGTFGRSPTTKNLPFIPLSTTKKSNSQQLPFSPASTEVFLQRAANSTIPLGFLLFSCPSRLLLLLLFFFFFFLYIECPFYSVAYKTIKGSLL